MSADDRPPAGVGDRLGPRYPGNLAWADKMRVPTNYGTVRIESETIWRFWNGSKQEVIGGHYEARCPCCYSELTVEGTSDEARADLVDDLLSCCDDLRWLPPSDYLDPCAVCGRSHRERTDCTAPGYRDPLPDFDQPAECTDCGWMTDEARAGLSSPGGKCPECDSENVLVGDGHDGEFRDDAEAGDRS